MYNKYGQKTTKSIQKSIRISEDTYEYILRFKGKSFNEKLERACGDIATSKRVQKLAIEEQRLQLEYYSLKIKKDMFNRLYVDYNQINSNLARIGNYLMKADDACGLNEEVYKAKGKLDKVHQCIDNARSYIELLEQHEIFLRQLIDQNVEGIIEYMKIKSE